MIVCPEIAKIALHVQRGPTMETSPIAFTRRGF
jgi:hypothetical protein